ncbi:MAG: dehydrogenase [Verrucomicrobiales bacterium]|nr:dehydrogenase [Verrucomicrobiales bacterium]|tara:strand:+ start:1103 stop:4912 length:3810 start_codon:yes stop_codon:yes gene_type:complete
MIKLRITLLAALLASVTFTVAAPPRVLFMIGEPGYKTAETLPAFAKAKLHPLGIATTFVHADSANPNHFPGLERIKDADVLFLSVRRRALSEAQMALIKAHLAAGRGLVAIRTSSHGFSLGRGTPPAGHVEWKDFDREVLGHRYVKDFNNKDGTSVSTLAHANREQLLTGIRQNDFRSKGSLYNVADLSGNRVLLRGLITHGGEPQIIPVAWSRNYKKSRVVYTSLGHESDFEARLFQQLLVNSIYWTAKQTVPGYTSTSGLNNSKARNKYDMTISGNDQVSEIIKTFPGRGEVGDHTKPTLPLDTLEKFQVNDDFEMEIVASEPTIRQPLYINWDHRGRMWVIQYLQYPFPAGLKVIKYDQWLRAIFDKVPAAPPNHVKGADKITVLEDTDGDGDFDTSKDVITGLNIATAVTIGRGGIWVLNPPYLLFYPDADGDDVPDRDPEVHLSGFGLEDTHSVANSMRWGPDGWIYGANGSTTTGTVSSEATKNVHFKGQCIWRYHPGTKIFEIYAEGGGNTFSVEIDAQGRVFSGTNHGKTRGMHYAQGGYGEKNWGKHGPLTNPYAFGYYDHMRHEGFSERFSQTFSIYDGGAFPAKYRHAVVAANALHNRVIASKLIADTSTFRTVDFPPLVLTSDRWFRPVDCKVGPDGAVYLADWYDSRLTHVDPRDNWHKSSGRIYRLKAKGAKPLKPFNLAKQSSRKLVNTLVSHPNKWFRQKALRVLADRKDTSITGLLRAKLEEDSSPRDLDALWALNLLGGFTDDAKLTALESGNPHIRRWAVRLIGDGHTTTPEIADRLQQLAKTEANLEVRSQLASTAKRLPAGSGLPIVRQLAERPDIDDLHIPMMLWWAVESKCDSDPNAVLKMFAEEKLWQLPTVRKFMLDRLMRRFAMAGSADDLKVCAKLLDLSPNAETTKLLISGLLQGFEGRTIKDLPSRLAKALDDYQTSLGNSALALGLRRGDAKSIDSALKVIADERADMSERLSYIDIVGQINQKKFVPTLTRLLRNADSSIKLASLKSLQSYDDSSIPRYILGAYHGSLLDEHGVRATANRVLASRKEWAKQFLERVDKWHIKADTVAIDVVQQMALHDDPDINKIIEKHWGRIRSTPEEKQNQITRIANLLKSNAGSGNAASGKTLFTVACGVCHTLFDEGGQVGPDLTGYERDNMDFMLLAVVDPSAAIREEFTNFQIETTDGRQLTGLIEQQDNRTVTLRGVDNQTVLLPRPQIKKLQASHTSIMPEGLTEAMNDQQLLDLFAYLTSRTPSRELKK